MAKIRFLSIALLQCFKIPSLGSATSRRWCSYGNLVKGFEALVCPKLEGSPELAAPLRLGLSPAPQVPHAHLHPAAPSRRVVGIPCAGPEEPARGLVSRAQVIGGTLGSSRGQCAPPFPSGAGSWELGAGLKVASARQTERSCARRCPPRQLRTRQLRTRARAGGEERAQSQRSGGSPRPRSLHSSSTTPPLPCRPSPCLPGPPGACAGPALSPSPPCAVLAASLPIPPSPWGWRSSGGICADGFASLGHVIFLHVPRAVR